MGRQAGRELRPFAVALAMSHGLSLCSPALWGLSWCCRKNCNSDKSEVRLAACSHCGAKDWNILGDSESGYVLSEGDGKHCLLREKNSKKAKIVSCEKGGYTALQLQCEQEPGAAGA